MPPQGMPRPDAATMDRFATWLETSIDRAAAAHPNPGRATLHRLNRTEYANAIRDLLGLDVDPAPLLPADDESYGFDDIADVLRTSPSLLDRYMSASWNLSRLAVGDPNLSRRHGHLSRQARPFAEWPHGWPAAGNARRTDRFATISRWMANTSSKSGCGASPPT